MTPKLPPPEELERILQRDIQRIRNHPAPGLFALCLPTNDSWLIIRKSTYPEEGRKGTLRFYPSDIDKLVEKLCRYQEEKQETLIVREERQNSFTIEHSEIEQVVALLKIAEKHYKNELADEPEYSQLMKERGKLHRARRRGKYEISDREKNVEETIEAIRKRHVAALYKLYEEMK